MSVLYLPLFTAIPMREGFTAMDYVLLLKVYSSRGKKRKKNDREDEGR